MVFKVVIAVAALAAIAVLALVAEALRKAMVAWLTASKASRQTAFSGPGTTDRFGRGGRGKVLPFRGRGTQAPRGSRTGGEGQGSKARR